MMIQLNHRPQWSSGKIWSSEPEGWRHDSTEDPLCMCACCTSNHPVGVVRKLEMGVPAQVSSSSSDHGSELQGPSQKSPRVASRRDINIT
ncbi:hypothetical protein AVEN_19595-1 [Araneus ventricosus]|uniref:Uncharacterized protein n=1 Tax=Araneus ventricosus TaxID=182803 RepID=A0A4Y2KV10_ARAVE|nr:hypothetical protein AVEN_19595-1 [Araneus ventricosus]